MRSPAMKKALGFGLGALTVLAAASPARANGRYPAAGLVAIDPSDPKHVVVRATYGVLSTVDDGATWTWVCEQSVGFSDNEDPMVSITKDGTIVAGTFNGLSSSTDRACSFAFAGGDLADRFAVDLSVEKPSPDHVLAIVSNGIGGGKFETRVYESLDDAKTWSQAGVDLPQDFLGLSIDSAPSDTQRIYTTGRFGSPDYTGAVMRSDDRGQTWTKLPIPSSNDQAPPYLSAIDPADPDRAYVRLDTADADVLMVTSDGGMTWAEAFKGTGPLLGFALSPDGQTVAVGGEKDGLWTAPKDTLMFTKVSDVGVRCLTWTPDRLYACADEFKDGFHVGYSTNDGKTFKAYEHLASICPQECPAGSTTAEKCGDQWGLVSLTINATCGSGGGGAGGTGGGTQAGGGGGSSGGGGGCSCDVAGGGSAGGALLFAAGVLSIVNRRRKRQRHSFGSE
ncbi:MAG: sialidase family protein [Polyangiaceae bacterium]